MNKLPISPKCEGTFNVDLVVRPTLFLVVFFQPGPLVYCPLVPAAVLFAGCMSDRRPADAGRLQQICVRRLLVNKVQTTLKRLLRFLLHNIARCFRTRQAVINSPDWFGVPPDWLSYYSGRSDSNNPWLSISNQIPHRPCLHADNLDNLSQ